MTTTTRLCVASFASLLLVSSLSLPASAQAGPPPDPNAQTYPPQGQPYPQQGYPQQQQQQYPQQGYPPQYPPQPPPGQQQYPQQGYPPQYPPQGQPYPPPSYPPSYGYPAPPPPPQGHRGLLLSGYLGLHGFVGDSGRGLSPGLRLGGMLGFYASPIVSLNAELSIDVLNPNSDSFDPDSTGARVVFSFSPLIHVPAGNIELVIGPKLGFWASAITLSDAGSAFTGLDSISASGYLVGLNAGLFARVGRIGVGGLLSIEGGYPTNICETDNFGNQICGDPAGNQKDADKVISVTGAVLF